MSTSNDSSGSDVLVAPPNDTMAFRERFPDPENTTILMTQVSGPNDTWINLPHEGDLWVAFEFAREPLPTVYIWHQGGQTTPVQPGFHTYHVYDGDALIYDVGDSNSVIKLGWAYV